MNQKIWIFIIEQKLDDASLKHLLQECTEFVHQWTSHDQPLKGECTLFKNRLLIFKNDETYNPVGGCAADKLFHFIQMLEKKYQTSLLNRQLIVFENTQDELEVQPLYKADDLIQAGIINEHTIIYNTALTHSDEWTQFAQVFPNSWLQTLVQ